MTRVQTINKYLHHGQAIVKANKRSGLKDLSLACALVEQESGGENIFGCDLGPRSAAPWCHQPVTKARVKALIQHVHAGGASNGVGLTQLTSLGLIEEAEREGGAHVPIHQCVVGFRFLRQLIGQYGHGGIWHYNGAPAYQAQIEAKERIWKQRLK